MGQRVPQQATDKLTALLVRCEQRLKYEFKDKDLLHAALTHASGAQHRLASNERLEFLGDAILGVVVCEWLYAQYPGYLEGELTRIKSMVVSRQTCAKLSAELGLDEFLILGKGIASHGKIPTSLFSDVFESLVAAIHLDGGDAASREFILRHIVPEIEAAVRGDSECNHKSELQQLVQREHGTTPTYKMIDQKGPDHQKFFKIAAEIHGTDYPPAWGKNKKEAEQRAALNALSTLDGQPVPYPCDDD